LNNSNNDKKPDTWEAVKIDDIYQIIGGGTPSTKNTQFWNGKIPWITSADISDDGKIEPRKKVTEKGVLKSATNIVPKGSLVVVTRVGLGKVAIAEHQLCFSQDIQALLLDDNFIDKKYAFYFLKQAVQIFKYSSRGTTISGVTKKQLRDLQFLLPPLPEQRRISEKIEELYTKLDAGIGSLKQVQILLKKYRLSVLKSAVEGKLTSKWRKKHNDELEPADKLLEKILIERRERWEAEQLANFKSKGKKPSKNWQNKYKEPIPPDTSELPELPEGWIWEKLSTIADVVSGYAFKSKDFVDTGIPVIKIANVSYGNFLWKQQQYLPKNFLSDYKAFTIHPNTILIALTRPITNNTVKVCIYPDDAPTALLNQRVAMIKPYEGYSKQLLGIILQSELFKEQIKKGLSETLQPNLSPTNLKEFVIPIPSLIEQNKILQAVEKSYSIIDESIRIVESEIKRSNSLRQSILKDAFEGKLVPQDPNDEPASVLLEKIKAEKSKLKN
jgi:type I restriction enzyme, S subunit